MLGDLQDKLTATTYTGHASIAASFADSSVTVPIKTVKYEKHAQEQSNSTTMNQNRKVNFIITRRQCEIYERGHNLGTGLRAKVAFDGVGGEAIEVAAEGARLEPLLELAVGVEVGPAVLATQ